MGPLRAPARLTNKRAAKSIPGRTSGGAKAARVVRGLFLCRFGSRLLAPKSRFHFAFISPPPPTNHHFTFRVANAEPHFLFILARVARGLFAIPVVKEPMIHPFLFAESQTAVVVSRPSRGAVAKRRSVRQVPIFHPSLIDDRRCRPAPQKSPTVPCAFCRSEVEVNCRVHRAKGRFVARQRRDNRCVCRAEMQFGNVGRIAKCCFGDRENAWKVDSSRK